MSRDLTKNIFITGKKNIVNLQIHFSIRSRSIKQFEQINDPLNLINKITKIKKPSKPRLKTHFYYYDIF